MFYLFLVIVAPVLCAEQVPPTVNTNASTPTNNEDPRTQSAWIVGDYNNIKSLRHQLADWLLGGCTSKSNDCKIRSTDAEMPGYDGWYNNLDKPDMGAIDGHLLRRWPAAYEDGTYKPSGSNRPNPIELSESLLVGHAGSKSKTGKNALLVFFGQQVVEEILDAQRPACPPEYFNISIPGLHDYKKYHSEMPFLRTRYDQRTGYNPNNPRQQLNEITPFIDGGLMYGTTKQWSDRLRTYRNGSMNEVGKLAESSDGLFPECNHDRLPMANPPPPARHKDWIHAHETAHVSRFFKLGNPRGNENTFLLTFGILWFRWHNYLAERIKHRQPHWTSDKIFNEARKWVIATYQHIVVYEWLPTWVNEGLPDYVKYDPSVNPQIDQFFQSAAFRFGHTLVVPGVYLRDYARNGCASYIPNWNKPAVRTCNSFWLPQEAIMTKYDNKTKEVIDIDRVLMGMAVQLCEEEDHKIVTDLRGNVFGPLEFPRRDLMAINIQRGRDHGLPDFNTAREAYGLSRITDFNHFQNVHSDVRENCSRLYNKDVNNIDPWVGGILETVDGPGEFFKTVIIDQFNRIRNGDRFWYENDRNGLFTKEEVVRIKQLTLYDVIMAVTKLDENDIQKQVFRVPTARNQISPNCTSILHESSCTFRNQTSMCLHLPQLNESNLKEPCIQGSTYDYFSNSQASYILTFCGIGMFIVATIGLIYVLIKLKDKEKHNDELRISKKLQQSFSDCNEVLHLASEWMGQRKSSRPVMLKCDAERMQLQVLSRKGTLVRTIDLHTSGRTLDIFTTKEKKFIIIKTQIDHDLVLEFESDYLLSAFSNAMKTFLAEMETKYSENLITKLIPQEIETYDKRKEKLDMFFRVVFAQAFKISYSKAEMLKVGRDFKEIAEFEITMFEFATVLGMHPETEFVQRMFLLIDKDRNGFISFREFTNLLVIFAKGTEVDKAKLLFDMYDIDAVGYLTREDFISMIKSFLDTVGGTVDESELEATVHNMLTSAGLQNKNSLDFNDFMAMVGDDVQRLNKATLGFKGVNENRYIDKARETIENLYWSRDELNARFQGANNFSKQIDDEQERTVQKVVSTQISFYTTALRYIENNSVYLFWKSFYTLVLLAIFAERAYHYSVEAEHGGLRRIAGYGVTITRGAASAMMFTYSSLLVTMARNLWSFLRDTLVGKYLPIDSMVEFHKYIAYCAIIATVFHIVGHAFNFYHISTQTSDDLTCLFRNYFHSTHEIPKFHYWAWQTLTGFTGIVLTIIVIIMYLFSRPIVRRRLYHWFWYTHNLYPLFFFFMVLHGAGRLIQEPFFHYFFLGPVILFVFDTVVSVNRKKIPIPVVRAKIWPSEVTMLEFIKPISFVCKSGQWVRIACLSLNNSEYHPFTLSSSPDEATLTVHIRAVGPWTKHIRKLYDEALTTQSLPQIYLDGPYGESHQDWYQFEVSILVGGGIGVTPFASILKDIVFKSNINYRFKCKKIYFIWVSKTQRQFEWMVDILSNLENNDKNGIVSAHIFITQFYEKFDLRTILLYICERHYQKISQKSLFTNLRAVTHFGRPSFPEFFKTVQSLHSSTSQIGVFSCGPPPMTRSVETACYKINQTSASYPLFIHHSKNF